MIIQQKGFSCYSSNCVVCNLQLLATIAFANQIYTTTNCFSLSFVSKRQLKLICGAERADILGLSSWLLRIIYQANLDGSVIFRLLLSSLMITDLPRCPIYVTSGLPLHLYLVLNAITSKVCECVKVCQFFVALHFKAFCLNRSPSWLNMFRSFMVRTLA